MKVKDYVVLHGEITTPPMAEATRLRAGYLLWLVQIGETLSLPVSRPMPTIGPRVHELRLNEPHKTWRVIYRIDANAVLIVEFFEKTTQTTPADVIRNCQRRLREYDHK